MKKHFRFITILIVLFGVWMLYWEPVDYVTTMLGPLWSTILATIIIAVGIFIWKVKAF